MYCFQNPGFLLRSFAVALLCAASLQAVSLHAQMHKVAAPERVTRAIGVYEWTGDLAKPTAARLVPITVFIDGHFEDAGVYLSRPVPFVLQTGVVYSIEKAGQPLGTLNLGYARNLVSKHSATDDNPLAAWYGYGNFALPVEAKKTTLHASAHPSAVVATSDPDRPHMNRRDDPPTKSTDTISHTPAATGSTSTDTSATATAPAVSDDDPDRPHMTRRSESTPVSGSASSSTTPDPDDPDRPTLRRHDTKEEKQDEKRAKKESGSGVTPLATSLNDDPNRPTMRRGKPPETTSTPQLAGIPALLHQTAAVSDATNRDEHVFTREWDSSTERATTLQAMQTLARPFIAKYIAANDLKVSDSDLPPTSPPAAKPSTKPAVTKAHATPKPAAPPPPPVLTLVDEELHGYSLSYGGLPTFVYTAEARIAAGGPVYMTLVAQRLPSGELQTALSSVTDAGHLNRTPWMRLVDAVDPDAGHRASLLFELRAQSSRQFALYRLTSATAEQTFVTGTFQ